MNQKLFNFSKTGGGSGGAGGGATAASIIYDNSVSGLIADDVQKAIDEIAALSGSGSKADQEFVFADLTVGVLLVPGLDPIAAIVDNTGKVVVADEITYGATDTSVDLSSYGSITGTWKVKFAVGAQGPAGTSPITTEGDIIVGDSSGDPDRLPVGNEGEVLTVVGGVPAWAAASGGGGDFLVMQVFS